MKVMLDLGFFAPRWAVGRPGRNGRNVWRPSVREYRLYARAMARHYDGRVRLWTTWNEPNHGVFLRPQWVRSGDGWKTATPHLYRRLHNAAYDQVKAVSKRNRVLIGGLSSFETPGRGPGRNMGPLRFTRELACVDRRLRPLTRPECRGFRPLRADGFAMHPYSQETAPGANDPGADRVQIGELAKLTSLLAELERRGRFAQTAAAVPDRVRLPDRSARSRAADAGGGRPLRGPGAVAGLAGGPHAPVPAVPAAGHRARPEQARPLGPALARLPVRAVHLHAAGPSRRSCAGSGCPSTRWPPVTSAAASRSRCSARCAPGAARRPWSVQRQRPGRALADGALAPRGRRGRRFVRAVPDRRAGHLPRVVPDQGPGAYRARWLEPGARPQVSPAASVGAPLPVPGGADAALRRG